MAELIEHRLVNQRGDSIGLLNFGARITSIRFQARDGPRDLVLGYDNCEDYLRDTFYMGCTVGRFCNRIAHSNFTINGVCYQLTANEGRHHLHGGSRGLDKQFWQLSADSNEKRAVFSILSGDGDQGYPGGLTVSAEYAWNDNRELTIGYRAACDKPTHVNLTNHAYFNLDKADTSIHRHRVRISAECITAVDDALIPTGELRATAGSPLDLAQAREISQLLDSADPLIGSNNGADFNYVLSNGNAAAEVWSGGGDLAMTVTTSYPGIQFYSGQHLGYPFQPYAGLCLEGQYFPDSPNQPTFPSTLLLPDQHYAETIRYSFRESALGA